MQQNTDPITQRQGLTQEEYEAFLGKNAGYYLEKWRANATKPYFKGWNFAAMFFRVDWMCYRKMYLEAALIFLGTMAISLTVVPLAEDLLAELLRTALQLLLGAFGNTLYRNKAIRTVRKTAGMDPDARLACLRKKGGTSYAGVIVSLGLQALIFAIPYIIRAYLRNTLYNV